MSELMLIRHGPVLTPGICYGQLDVPTKIPRANYDALVEELAQRSSNKSVCLWSSPSIRCVALSHSFGEHFGWNVRKDARIVELSFGEWEGRRWAELEQEPDFMHWAENWKTEKPPGGEDLLGLLARVREFISELPSADLHVAVTHAGVIRALSVLQGNVSWDCAMSRPVPHLKSIWASKP